MDHFRSEGLSNEIRLIVKDDNRKPSLTEGPGICSLIR